MRAQKKIFLSASQMNCAKRGIVATTAETTLSTGGASRGLEQSHTGRLGEDLIWRSPETRFSQRCHDPCDISPGEQEDGERYIPWDDMPEGAAGLVCWRSWEADQSSGRRSRRRCEGKEVGITERKRDCSRCMCRWRRGGGGGGGGGRRMCVDKHQTGEARSNAGLRSSFPILSAAKLSGRRRVDQQLV